MMSKVQEYIKNRSENSTEFTQQIEIERKRLELAMKLTELRKSTGLTQKELSEKIGKPQSTISRIETGEMNPTIELVIEIANGMGKNFVPIFE
ncbi:Helix-turn-helix [Atopostipes suicloacalis DSM 15692]|uniref:Helix-turn-helix n=2 Tax=Atopostipes suicloacalis TaxID=180295 RepID=A0A1M4SME8_9LACT|nr:Helix-turn-helix [Atopostipes suicloacalis DSM 15692]